MAPQANNPIQAPFVETPRLSLLRTFAPADVADQLVGFNFFPEGCGESGTGDPSWCATNDKPIPDNPPRVDVFPSYAWAGDKCGAFSVDERDWAGRARRQLASTFSYQVARELWRGEQAEANAGGDPDFENAYLASDAALVVSGAPLGPVDALSVLEQAIGDCSRGPRGTIHAPRAVFTQWRAWDLVRREGNALLTDLDTVVVVDAGYDGSGPRRVAAADGSVWAYATGTPIVQQGPEHVFPDSIREAIDTRTNQIEYRIERKFAAGWDGCCHLAVEVDVPWTQAGS